MLVGSTAVLELGVAHEDVVHGELEGAARRCRGRWWRCPGGRGRRPAPGSRSRPAPAPRLTAVVVLPTPPFWLATAMTLGSAFPEAACAAGPSSATGSAVGSAFYGLERRGPRVALLELDHGRHRCCRYWCGCHLDCLGLGRGGRELVERFDDFYDGNLLGSRPVPVMGAVQILCRWLGGVQGSFRIDPISGGAGRQSLVFGVESSRLRCRRSPLRRPSQELPIER